ncbi:MAG TPA: tetratricopeptide repeat protein, partial [Chitinophagales bacterium]|nr:tetratricopeptide repeat protein [Chitinophagales bacterium]
DKALADYNKAIELDPRNADFYNNRGNVWRKKKEYEKALADYDKAIELDPTDAKAYGNRGIVWDDKKEYEKALADYNKAIELDPTDAIAYNNRGIVWSNKKEYDKALVDYNKGIELDPTYAIAYNNRGIVWSNKKEYDKALADYNKAIELDPTDASAYNNRGNVWRNKKEYGKALADYDKAIELNKGFALAYRNRGILLEEHRKDYEGALENYNKAIELDPEIGRYASLRRDALLEKLKEQKEVEKVAAPTKGAKSLEKLREQLIKTIQRILKFAVATRHESVVHYTKRFVVEILLGKDNPPLRYYNAIYMNDPAEGETVFECFSEETRKGIKDAYDAGKSGNEISVYLGSFLANSKGDAHEDELVLWRTYGKDEAGIEAAGYNLVIDAGFFDKHDEKKLEEVLEQSTGVSDSTSGHALYKVIYYKSGDYVEKGKRKEELKKVMTELEEVLTQLIKMQKSSKKKEDKEIIDGLIFRHLSRISYLFKSADYAYEHEVRVIQHMPRGTSLIKVDDKGIAPKLYIESNKPVFPHLRKIFVGPKVANAENWATYFDYVISKKGKDDGKDYPIKVYKSTCKFR